MAINYDLITERLQEYNQVHVLSYINYLKKIEVQKKEDKETLVNPWMAFAKADNLADLFERVHEEGLVFDGKHITLQSRGITYDYIAYKNKLLLTYPELTIDFGVVYEGDTFTYHKDDGIVHYKHERMEPFDNDTEKIIGVFCFIKTRRGEFMTMLDREEINAHRRKSKTDFIWRDWFVDMAYKTVIRKACKVHFDDVFQTINEEDNEQYNMDIPADLDLKWKQEIDAITTRAGLDEYYQKNSGKGSAFDQYIVMKKKSLTQRS